MAQFNEAFENVLLEEGGFVDDPNDKGGITKYGISQKSYPYLDIAKLTKEDAEKLYKKDYWDSTRIGEIQDQKVANKLFSLAVNMGIKNATLCLQRAARSASGVFLIEDGILGKNTIANVNLCKGDVLLAALKSEAAAIYRAFKNPRFERGWLNRAYR